MKYLPYLVVMILLNLNKHVVQMAWNVMVHYPHVNQSVLSSLKYNMHYCRKFPRLCRHHRRYKALGVESQFRFWTGCSVDVIVAQQVHISMPQYNM